MATNTQFSIAVHMMTVLAHMPEQIITSTNLSTSVNTSPSFVRRVLSKLSKAGLVQTAMGKTGACWLAKDAKDISLLDMYHAVDAPKVFSIHRYPEHKACVVSCNIKGALEKSLIKTQLKMEQELAETSLAQITSEIITR